MSATTAPTTCCDGTGWTGNPRTPCAEHYEQSDFLLYRWGAK